ncbi:LysR family transcriptional regulator [Pandoraea sputorum]|uniref:LysR family transcriptional regulator n=1 Tax=Pandoraea sputorum TaxID=93222 RepID=A0A5E5B6H2_9BURK|nr:LysR family transcriptional regulator [Pandoraea sputorum]VVE79960.1 LysR family transcriptional regulator [Pandoraea sputorum]
MELRHLQYFIAVAQERHFTRAAARVGIQQPPLSLQIKQLEAELGGPLFVRLPRDVVLTELGEAFLPEARQILERVERARRRMQQISRGEAGHIRIGFAGATYFEPRIPAWIRDFRARYPDVQLHPQQSNTASLLTALVDDAVDAAFVRTPFDVPPGIVSLPVVDEPMVLVLPLGHPMCAQAPVPTATPGISSMECDGPHGKVWIDMAHAGLWLFVAMGQGPVALAAHAPTPVGTDDNAPLIASTSQSPSALDPLAVARDTAHRLCLARLAGEGESLTAGADVPLLAHPYVSVPYAGQTRYLYDMSVSSRLTVVAARDSIVHRMRAFGWQN